MRILVIGLLSLLLGGCGSFWGVQKFPPSSELLLKECEKLDKVPEETKLLSDAEKVVSGNYKKYHECAAKVDGWIKWYNSEKAIYEEAAK